MCPLLLLLYAARSVKSVLRAAQGSPRPLSESWSRTMKASAVKGPVGRSASAALFSSAAAACVLSALGILLWTSQCSEALQTPTPSLRIGPPQPDCSGGDMDAPTANPTTRASACNSEGEEPMTFSSWNSSSSSTSSSSSSSINREGFLRNAAGLGLGFAVGLSREPEPAYALFGECTGDRALAFRVKSQMIRHVDGTHKFL